MSKGNSKGCSQFQYLYKEFSDTASVSFLKKVNLKHIFSKHNKVPRA